MPEGMPDKVLIRRLIPHRLAPMAKTSRETAYEDSHLARCRPYGAVYLCKVACGKCSRFAG